MLAKTNHSQQIIRLKSGEVEAGQQQVSQMQQQMGEMQQQVSQLRHQLDEMSQLASSR